MNHNNEMPNLMTFPMLPSLIKDAVSPNGVYLDGRWVFDSPVSEPFPLPIYGKPVIGTFRIDTIERYAVDVFKRYAQLINHGRPRKVSWRRLNRQQRERAMQLA